MGVVPDTVSTGSYPPPQQHGDPIQPYPPQQQTYPPQQQPYPPQQQPYPPQEQPYPPHQQPYPSLNPTPHVDTTQTPPYLPFQHGCTPLPVYQQQALPYTVTPTHSSLPQQSSLAGHSPAPSYQDIPRPGYSTPSHHSSYPVHPQHQPGYPQQTFTHPTGATTQNTDIPTGKGVGGVPNISHPPQDPGSSETSSRGVSEFSKTVLGSGVLGRKGQYAGKVLW